MDTISDYVRSGLADFFSVVSPLALVLWLAMAISMDTLRPNKLQNKFLDILLRIVYAVFSPLLLLYACDSLIRDSRGANEGGGGGDDMDEYERVYIATVFRHIPIFTALIDQGWRLYLGTSNILSEQIEEIRQSDRLVLYVEAGIDYGLEAVVMAGIAVSMGVPVFHVSDHPASFTFSSHPLWHTVKTLDEALTCPLPGELEEDCDGTPA